MRIIAGHLKGKALASVGKGDAAAHLRPTTDRIRESLFNVLMGGAFADPIADARVLDLFAGTGALGLEALSRGAEHVTFIDNGIKARALIRKNIDLTHSQGKTDVFRRDATKPGERLGEPFNLVFLDPPYGMGLGEKALAGALKGGWFSNDVLIVWEENHQPALPPGFTQVDQRKYGDTYITFLELSE